MTGVWLEDRGIVEVAGAEAGELLQRLVTNDVLGLARGEARYAALLTPQGKIVVDFLIAATQDASFLLDCPRYLAADLAKKLTLYRLRAKATITDRSQDLGVAALWPDAPNLADALVVRDPRHPSLGYRAVAPHAVLADLVTSTDQDAYAAHRIDAGVPEGGADFAYGDAFPHDANLDVLNGVDFSKGCYVGQEVVSRVQHRGTARKRIRPVIFQGTPPPAGAEVMVGEIAIGTMGSAVPGRGLAMVRIDRAAEAAALGAAASAAGVHLSIGLG